MCPPFINDLHRHSLSAAGYASSVTVADLDSRRMEKVWIVERPVSGTRFLRFEFSFLPVLVRIAESTD
jgi:hypothetical protein